MKFEAKEAMTYRFTQDYVTHLIPLWEEHLETLAGKADIHFLEIGSFEGRSTLWFLENILTGRNSRITCVDSFVKDDGEENFRYNIDLSGFGDKVTVIKGNSEVELLKLPYETFDAVYVDGCHNAVNVVMDAMAAWRLLKKGGLMIFDDYQWRVDRMPPEERPEMAIDFFLKFHESDLEIRHIDYQVIIRKTG